MLSPPHVNVPPLTDATVSPVATAYCFVYVEYDAHLVYVDFLSNAE